MDPEVLSTYLSESEDRLMDIESGVLALESYGEEIDEELIHSVFRDAHSIKAGANLLGLVNIERLAHGLENVLDLIREGRLVPDKIVASLLLEAVDTINELFEDVLVSDERDISDLHEQLCYLAEVDPD
ncbi:Hpt domain-containing protein [Paucidesulfovibrio longus]|uniref:Hpt domain-containing protein n=1 Tax=Paucidesulfovibrio longus TaxID=889 RepID=UPI0005912FA4|nr:Hpt domain-containing protein [Paucidesulfovibrio longus]